MNIPDLIRVAGNYIRTTTISAFDNNDLAFDVYDPTKIESEGGLLEVEYDIPHKREVIYVLSKSGNTLTIADNGRGLYGTNAQDHPSNSKVRDFFVADHINQFTSTILGIIYPIGSIYISTNSSLPAYISSLGTWATFGAGRVLVGRDSGDTDFDTAEETGGSKTHQHRQGGIGKDGSSSAGGTQYGSWNTDGGFGISSTSIHFPNYSNVVTEGVAASKTVYPWLTSGESSLQPYIVVYMWKRTA